MPKNNQNNQATESSEIGSEELAIKFSARLVDLLGSKMRSHNKKNQKDKVSLSQLKSVYKNAARNYNYAGYSRGEWALARVNLFLRVMEGEKPEIIKGYEQASLGGLVFESKLIKKEEHDVSLNWVPSQEDFTTAKIEIKESRLDYHFNSIAELYLDDYEKIEFNIH